MALSLICFLIRRLLDTLRVCRIDAAAKDAEILVLHHQLGREYLDRTLIFNRRHLEAVRAEYVEHCNGHRSHRSLDQAVAISTSSATSD